jgi:hypothetical protein
MKNVLIKMILSAAAAAAASGANAAVIQSFGDGSAVKTVTNSASFQANMLLLNDYVEDGLLFHYVGTGNNNMCGYEGYDCYDFPTDLSPAFSGNYMATGGTNSYISVRKANGADFYRIEFAAGSGYLNLNGYWQTYNDGLRTAAGNFSGPRGTVLGLADAAGFDEVRYFAFSTANKQSGFSAPALDEVSVGVPEPGTLALVAGSLALMGGLRRRRNGQPGR